jgi:hypothetical protein
MSKVEIQMQLSDMRVDPNLQVMANALPRLFFLRETPSDLDRDKQQQWR